MPTIEYYVGKYYNQIIEKMDNNFQKRGIFYGTDEDVIMFGDRKAETIYLTGNIKDARNLKSFLGEDIIPLKGKETRENLNGSSVKNIHSPKSPLKKILVKNKQEEIKNDNCLFGIAR